MLIWFDCTVWEESTLHDSYSSQSVKKPVETSPESNNYLETSTACPENAATLDTPSWVTH
jgi:hypothetical protein